MTLNIHINNIQSLESQWPPKHMKYYSILPISINHAGRLLYNHKFIIIHEIHSKQYSLRIQRLKSTENVLYTVGFEVNSRNYKYYISYCLSIGLTITIIST